MMENGWNEVPCRGIDDNGNVANHTEIEQIVYMQTLHLPPLTYVNSEGENSFINKTSKLYSFV